MSVLNAKYNFRFVLVFDFRCVFVRFRYLLGSVCAVPRMYSFVKFLVFLFCFSINILNVCNKFRPFWVLCSVNSCFHDAINSQLLSRFTPPFAGFVKMKPFAE